ncbi:type II toxin-antitoxin system RelE family toxin [Pyxidicoccus sp. 3LFB2]
MESPTPSSPSTYAVEVAPSAWRQLGHLSHQDYSVLQQRLTALVTLASEGRLPDPRFVEAAGLETALSLTVGDFVLLYQVDPMRAAIRLTEVTLRLTTIPPPELHR